MKRILIVTPIFPPRTGGPSTYTWELASRLKKVHQVTIICFSNNPTPLGKVRIIPISQSGNSISRQFKLFTTILKQASKADLVYIQGPLVVGLSATIAARLKATKIIIKFVGDEIWETARIDQKTSLDLISFYQHDLSFTDTVKANLQRISFELANFIVVPSRFLKEFLTNHHGLNPQKIHTIANASKYTTNKQHKTPHSLIFAGRLVPWKNLDQIIKAVKIARKAHPWQLAIIGEGPLESKIHLTINRMHDHSWIKFLGRLSHNQTRDHIARSKKIILYSDYEGLPHVLIEAMLHKTAIVASDIPANHQVSNDLASFAPLGNIKALSQAINSKSTNTSKAQTYAQKTYTWNNHLKQFHKLL